MKIRVKIVSNRISIHFDITFDNLVDGLTNFWWHRLADGTSRFTDFFKGGCKIDLKK